MGFPHCVWTHRILRLLLGSRLFLLLLVVGGLFTLLSLASVREYSAAVNQQLNRNLGQIAL